MGVERFEDLVCWQLARALKCEVLEFTAKPPAPRDFEYCNQIRKSSASSPSNIAEAFGRYRGGDGARFCEYAIASFDETRNHLIDGRDRGYLSPALCSRLSNLDRSARRATRNWMLSLKRNQKGGAKS
jgi:four helix bundle protein